MIDPYVVLVMPFNFILSNNLSFVLSKCPVLIMAILVMLCHTILYIGT